MTVEWPKSVRVARESDEAPLFDLLMALYKDNGVGIVPRPMDVRTAIRAGTREKNGTLIGVIDAEHGALAGSVCIVPANWWYAQETWYLAERWVFVDPQWRHGLRLYDDLFRYALAYKLSIEQETGQKWPLISSVTSTKRLEAKMRLWRRYGKLVVGIYVIENDSHAASEPQLVAVGR